MPRIGTPTGADADTQLLLAFRARTPADWSENGHTITVNGSPTYLDGYYGEGVRFPTSSDYLSVADHSSINFALDFTAEAWIYLESASVNSYIFNRQGASNDAWALYIDTSQQLVFKHWNDAQDLDTVTLTDALQLNRWTHVRAVADLTNGWLCLYVDGGLVAKQATTHAETEAASLDALEIGASTTSGATGNFVGVLADLRLRDTADTSVDSLAPNVRPEHLTRRKMTAAEIDLSEELQDETWTATGSNGYWLAFANVDLSGLIVDPEDVAGASYVDDITTDSEVTLTRVGNVDDCDSTTDSYFIDIPNSRVYLNTNDADPSGHDFVKMQVTYRTSDIGLMVGGRYYRPSLLTSQAGGRSMPFMFENYPTGTGAAITLAAQHGDHPAGWTQFDASGVLWVGSPVRMYLLSDSMPRAEWITTFTGAVDEYPTETLDAVSVSALSNAAKLHKLPVLRKRTNPDDFPDGSPYAEAYSFPVIIGRTHWRAQCVLVDSDTTTIDGKLCQQWKVTDTFPCAQLSNFKRGLETMSVYNVDLDAGTFWMEAGGEATPEAQVRLCDVAGFGNPTTATSPSGVAVGYWGDEDDTYLEPETILKQVLATVLDLSTTDDFDSTWSTTGARTGVYLRLNETLDQDGDLVEFLKRFTACALVFLYQNRDGSWGLRDVNKNEASAWTIADADVISEEWQPSREHLAQRAEVKAWTQWYVSPTFGIGSVAELDLKGGFRFGAKKVWEPWSGGQAYFYCDNGTDTWLAAIRGLLEDGPIQFYRAVVGARFETVELMDVVTLSVSSLPSGAGARFRVMSARPQPDGTMDLVLFPEAPFPTDGTSSANERDPAMPLKPLHLINLGDSSGVAVATGTNYVDNSRIVFAIGSVDSDNSNGQGTGSGGAGGFASGTTHRFSVAAKRIGGSSDSDLTFDIFDITNGATLATTPGFGTSTSIQASTTFSNVPTDTARIGVRSIGANGATGTLYSLTWQGQEVSPTTGQWSSPIVAWHWSKQGGQAISTGTAQHVTGSPYFLPPWFYYFNSAYTYWFFCVYCTVSSPSGLTFGLRHYGHNNTYYAALTAEITATGFHGDNASAPVSTTDEMHLVSNLTSGSATLYEASLLCWQRLY